MNKHQRNQIIWRTLFSLLVACPVMADEKDKPVSSIQPAKAEQEVSPLFATVNGVDITLRDFHGAYANYLRQNFYHGQVPVQRLQEAKDEVATKLIEAILFREEVKRQKIEPDTEAIEKQLTAYDSRYAANPNWQQTRVTALAGLREYLSEQSRFERLEKQVKNIPASTDEEVMRFYRERSELFTEPEKLRLHSILLHVDPSSTVNVWDAAREEAAGIVKRLRAGADFEETARMRSRDKSSAAGGDMGYLHRGMLPEGLHERIDKMALGEISDPIDVLEGVAIFRLDDRKVAKLRDFADVVGRVRELLLRERQTKAWNDYREQLRRNAKIAYHEQPKIAPGQ